MGIYNMTKQLAQTFTSDGHLLQTATVTTEQEYCELMTANADKYGDGCYTVCSAVEEEAQS
jgi:hypothetical protein